MTITAPDHREESPPVAAPVEVTGEGIGAAVRTISGVTMISRLTGLARDAVCSRLFGAGPIWSAFAFAFLLPNLFRRLFGEGALSAAFLPEYARLSDEDSEKARVYAGVTVRWLLLALGVATIAGEGILVGLVAWGGRDTADLALRLAMIMLPFMPLVCATAIAGAMLQCHGRFGLPAAAPILVNASIIAAAIIWTFGFNAPPQAAIYAVAAGVLLAGLIQLIWSLLTLKRDRPNLRGAAAPVRRELRRTFRRMGPVAVGMSALQINTLIDGLIASWPILVGSVITLPFLGAFNYPLDEASNSILFFGQRLYHFPLGVFGIALATAVFPTLSRAAAHDEFFAQTLQRGVRLSLFIGLPASIGMVMVRDPLVFIIYRGGEFTAGAGARVADVLLGYAPGVWAFGLTHVITRAFYARGDTRSPMRVSLWFIGANFALNITLIWFFREAALAWSTTTCAVGQCFVLIWLCRRRWRVSAFESSMVAPVAKIMLLSAVMGAAVAMTNQWLPSSDSWWGQLTNLGMLVLVGGAVYGVLAKLMRLPELGWLLEKTSPAQSRA